MNFRTDFHNGSFQAALILALVLVVGLAMWPALYNGFPIMLLDSNAYLVRLADAWPYQPIFYVVFVRVFTHMATLYGVIVAQAMICVSLLLLAFRRIAGTDWLMSIFAAACLLLVSQLPLLASLVMPDVFGGLGALCIILLMLGERRSRPSATAFLLVVALFAALAATANALLFLPLGVACLAMRKWLQGSTISRRMWLASIAFAILAFSTPLAVNGLLYGKPTLAMGSSARMISKLVDQGFAEEFLEQHCPTESLPACQLQRQIHQIRGDEGFLWAGTPPLANSTGAWNDFDGSWGLLARRIATSHWRGLLALALSDSWSTLGQLSLPAGWMGPHLGAKDSVWSSVSTVHPELLQRYEAARQQSGELKRDFPDWFYRISTLASYFLAVTLLVWHALQKDKARVAFACAIVVAVVGSAIIHGGLVAPTGRYNAKCSWLAWLVPAMFMLQYLGAVRARVGAGSRNL